MRLSTTHPDEAGHPLWAYLGDPMPTDGPRRLIEQKRVVDRTAALERRRIGRYVVDSGSALTREGRGTRLQGMIDEVGSSKRKVTLVIAGVSNLAAAPDAVMATIADLLKAGVVLKDASGELHPEAATVELFASTAARMPRRRTPSSWERENG